MIIVTDKMNPHQKVGLIEALQRLDLASDAKTLWGEIVVSPVCAETLSAWVAEHLCDEQGYIRTSGLRLVNKTEGPETGTSSSDGCDITAVYDAKTPWGQALVTIWKCTYWRPSDRHTRKETVQIGATSVTVGNKPSWARGWHRYL